MSFATAIFSFLGSVWTLFLYTWWLFLIIWLFALRKKWGRWPIDAVIIEKRGENLIKTNDRIGKKFDKHTGMTYYQLWKAKDTIPICNYEWMVHNVNVHTNLFERFINLLRPTVGTLFLFRYGSKQYKPINTGKHKEAKIKLKEIKDEEGNPIYKYEYIPFDPRKEGIGTLNFDVIDWDNMNFMVQEQRASIVRRAKKGEFWAKTLIPIMIIGACVLVGIFILKFSADVGMDLRSGGTKAPSTDTGGGSKLMGGIQDVVTPGA